MNVLSDIYLYVVYMLKGDGDFSFHRPYRKLNCRYLLLFQNINCDKVASKHNAMHAITHGSLSFAKYLHYYKITL